MSIAVRQLGLIAIAVAACATCQPETRQCSVDDSSAIDATGPCTVRGHCGWFDDVVATCAAFDGTGTRCTCSGAAAAIPAFDTAAEICPANFDDDVAARILRGCSSGETSFPAVLTCSGAFCGPPQCDPFFCARHDFVCNTDLQTLSSIECVPARDCAAGRAVLDGRRAPRAPTGPVLVFAGSEVPADGTPWHALLAPETSLDGIGTLTALWSDGGLPRKEDVTVLVHDPGSVDDGEVDVALPPPVRPIAIEVESKDGASNVVCAD